MYMYIHCTCIYTHVYLNKCTFFRFVWVNYMYLYAHVCMLSYLAGYRLFVHVCMHIRTVYMYMYITPACSCRTCTVAQWSERRQQTETGGSGYMHFYISTETYWEEKCLSHTHARTHARMHARTHAHTHTRTHTHTHTQTQTSRQAKIETQLKAKKQESARWSRETSAIEKQIRVKEVELNHCKPLFIKAKEKTSHVIKRLEASK